MSTLELSKTKECLVAKDVISICDDRDERLLRIEEAATLLGLEPSSVYHLVSQRRIPVVRISSRCIRFSRHSLAKWVEDLSVYPAPDRKRNRFENKKGEEKTNEGT